MVSSRTAPRATRKASKESRVVRGNKVERDSRAKAQVVDKNSKARAKARPEHPARALV